MPSQTLQTSQTNRAIPNQDFSSSTSPSTADKKQISKSSSSFSPSINYYKKRILKRKDKDSSQSGEAMFPSSIAHKYQAAGIEQFRANYLARLRQSQQFYADQADVAQKAPVLSKTQSPEADNSDDSPQNQFSGAKLEESQIAPWMYKPLPEQNILVWRALSRPFKKRNKKYYSTVAIIALLISLILAFAGQLAAIAVVIAVSFLAYTLSVIPPQDVTYKITTWGVWVEGKLYYWEELGRFWFTEKFDHQLLNIECARFPNRLTLLLNEKQNKEELKMILQEVLLNQKPELTFYEKMAQLLQEKIPLDIEE